LNSCPKPVSLAHALCFSLGKSYPGGRKLTHGRRRRGPQAATLHHAEQFILVRIGPHSARSRPNRPMRRDRGLETIFAPHGRHPPYQSMSERARTAPRPSSASRRCAADLVQGTSGRDRNLRTGKMALTPELEALLGLEPGSMRCYADFRAQVHPDDSAA